MATPTRKQKHLIIAVLWPSFLVAIAASGIFFSAFDPEFLFPFGSQFGISRLGIYTLGFFSFWLLLILSAMATLYFAISNDLNFSDVRPSPERDQLR
ncbi:MAG: hypothetical protein ACI9LO_002319 [Planctomycetota bacterium]|jgi:hypothetical protein